MLDYLEKFDKLSVEAKQKISSPVVLAKITKLEKEYGVKLAVFIIKIIIKEITLRDLENNLAVSLGLINAQKLVKTLQIEILNDLTSYLDLVSSEKNISSASNPFQSNPPSPLYQGEINQNQDAKKTEQPFVKYAGDGEISSPLPEVKEVLVKGTNFFFSSDDENEVRELAKEISNYSNKALPEEYLLDQIISQVKINFSSEALSERFKQFLKTYLRGIRSRIETKQALIKSFETGGLSFEEDLADQVLFIVDSNLKNSTQEQKIKPLIKIETAEIKKDVMASLKNIGVRDFEYDLTALVKQKKVNDEAPIKELEKENVFKKIDTTHELAPLVPAKIETVKSAEPVKEMSLSSLLPTKKFIEPIKAVKEAQQHPALRQIAMIKELKQEAIPKNINLSQRTIITSQAESANKIRIEDIKFVPRVMSPIDELKYLDLVNFRRLGSDAEKATEKIKGKINLLEEESYTKRLDGIKAWRSSFVNKLYLNMGQSGISANKPINVIIEERKKKEEDYLTVSEFEAIMDLNKSLRF
ncbi:hypothetical protein KKC67_00600 [Patescibacteria group bacterium]|nr:hypothetical protein [Patescibacteria group bacterium]MBU0879514.1 hypothetical protein [Patescibacteria group bacterium]MBU0879899.1 hypothetical protein [Patescibacteria group bacterium]MBU1062722.1 hypothetical protein [Patescibacteria group bacterium]MBU1783435.1 hypothetical protein [Patescibacteria group bacterium]